MPENNDPRTAPLTPHLSVNNAAAAIDFYKNAFGATELARHMAPDGKRIMHASLLVNGGTLMLNDEFPEYMGGKRNTPDALGGTPVTLHLQTTDADALFNKAVEAGATVRMPLMDQFWGDRYGQLQDPFGHIWSIGAAKEKKTPEQLEQGAKESFAKADAKAHM